MSAAEPVRFSSREALMAAAADALADALEHGLDARGRACAALSGGSTPEPAYALLAARELDWPNICFALVDERFVPPTHDASNEKMLRRALAPALAKGATLAPLYAPEASLEAAAARAEQTYAQLQIDIALMGMGEDGHTASWFAGGAGLAQALDPAGAASVLAVRAENAAGSAERLTMTFSASARIPHVVLALTGQPKWDGWAKACAPGAQAPVSALLRHPAGPPTVLWAA